MIKSNISIHAIKSEIEGYSGKPVTVKLNMGRNKFVNFTGTVNGVYSSLFTVCPDDKAFLGKTAYSYSEVLCGRVKVKERKAE